jgi:hypothetical protein
MHEKKAVEADLVGVLDPLQVDVMAFSVSDDFASEIAPR